MRSRMIVAALLALLTQRALAADNFTVAPTTVADEKAVFATVESANVVPARARIGGTVAQLSVKEGDKVNQGQVVATVGDDKLVLQMKSLDDVGATYYLCQDQGIPIARSLGRHTNDHMVSFYLQTPSGFDVEYGWGARVVDDSTWQVQFHTSGSMWGHRPVSR